LSYDVFRVEIKGLFPIRNAAQVTIATAVFDASNNGSNGEPTYYPVTCFLDQFQEQDSRCYQDLTKLGIVEPDSGFIDWVTVANIIPDTLTAPYSGARQLRVFVTLFDANDPPEIVHGFIDGPVLGSFAQTFEYVLKNTGYQEASENRRRAEELTIYAAISVGLADGNLADTEGNILKRWVARNLDMVPPDKRDARKKQLNAALMDGFDRARAGTLDLGAVLAELSRIAEQSTKAEAIELCLEVMSADGVADSAELLQVNRIADKLGVDMQRFQDMKDKHIAALSTTASQASDYHALLGIDRNWTKEEIRTHLNRMYSQWNSRAESLEDPEKRSQAEGMLERIAGARRALLG
jgi:uncharacterized tellurite resistance protein B-like protein